MQTWPQPVRLATTGPMLRYDRPQAGRYRQFWQFDVEAIGDPGPETARRLVTSRLALADAILVVVNWPGYEMVSTGTPSAS